MATKEKEERQEESEQVKINLHREKLFRDVLGDEYPQAGIDRLVSSLNVSYYDALRLKENGCPPDLIVDILADE